MASAVPVPDQPGRLYLPGTNTVVQQDQTYEGSYYDCVEFVSFVDGTTKFPFKDQTDKTLNKTNLSTTKRIPSYAKLKLQRIGCHVSQWVGTARTSPEDTLAAYEMVSLTFLIGKTNLIAEGVLLEFPSGLGITGVSTANDFSALTNGVASQAAVPRLLQEADINDKVDLNAVLQMGNNTYMTVDDSNPTIVGNGVASHFEVRVALRGIITRPLGS
jgi:hypothetical protein